MLTSFGALWAEFTTYERDKKETDLKKNYYWDTDKDGQCLTAVESVSLAPNLICASFVERFWIKLFGQMPEFEIWLWSTTPK